MTKIGYKGSLKTFRIKVGSNIIRRWDKNEIRDFSESDSKLLLKNKDFYKVRGGKPEEKKKDKKEKVIEEVKEEEVEEKVFDYKIAGKDELLDFTAVHNIVADYSMDNDELRKLIKEYLENQD